LRRIVAGGIAAAMLSFALMFAGPVAAQNYSDGYKFLQAVEKKDRAKLDELFAKNHTVVNARDLSDGHTGLHIAVERRDMIWLGYLADMGANPNIADSKGVTPLARASQIGFIDGIQRLIAAGAQVDIPSSTGETPLIAAVHRRDTAMMRVLLQAGADPDRADNSGRSARDYAGFEGPGSVTLSEIERSAKSRKERAAASQVYGPSF
jgi:ankyrin repeat protein